MSNDFFKRGKAETLAAQKCHGDYIKDAITEAVELQLKAIGSEDEQGVYEAWVRLAQVAENTHRFYVGLLNTCRQNLDMGRIAKVSVEVNERGRAVSGRCVALLEGKCSSRPN